MKGRPNQNTRIISYLCYLPKQMSSDKNNIKRIQALEKLRTTTHMVNKIKLFPTTPQTYGQPLPQVVSISPPILTSLGKSLCGLIR